METKTFDTLPPIKYDANIAGIAKLKEEYMPLAITDINDKEQFDAVHEGRMVMVKVRTNIERQRKEQKASALEHGRKVDAKAGELTALSTPIESHLQTEEDKVTKEQERIKAEKDRIEKEKIQGRVDALQKYGVVLPFADVAGMEDGVFEFKLEVAKLNYEEEQKRIADEVTRLTEERAELDRKATEQAAKDKEVADKEEVLTREREAFENERKVIAANLKAQTDALEKEKREAKEKAGREEFEKQAKDNAKAEAEQYARAEVERKKREAEVAKAEAARQEALKPDKEKLLIISKGLMGYVFPDVVSDDAENILAEAKRRINQVALYIQEKSEVM